MGTSILPKHNKVTSVNGETGDVIINRVALADNLYSPDNNEMYGEYVFRTSGGTADISSGEAELLFINGNTIPVGRVEMSCTANYIASGSSSDDPPSVRVDANTFASSTLGGSSGTYTFTYSSGWRYNSSSVSLDAYGITVTGAPSNGDQIVVTYTAMVRGTLNTATPTSFRSIGLNQFDKDHNILSGYTINASGNIVASSGKYVAYIHAVGGLTQGYTAYSSAGGIVRVAYSSNIPTAGATGLTVLGSNATTNSGMLFSNDGYLCVATTNIETLCVHPTWSGYEDATYEEYSKSVITIPTVDVNGDPLPTASYGMPSIGSIYDTLSFATRTYTQRIGHYAYSAANLETVKALGVAYDYDATDIFYVLNTPVVFNLASSVDGTYTVADFGTEEFLGTTAPVLSQSLYGENLRDKLRRMTLDYAVYKSVSELGLTIGSATISGAWAAMPNNSIIICNAAEFSTSEVPITAGTVEMVKFTTTRGWILLHGKSESDYRMFLSSGGEPTGTWVPLQLFLTVTTDSLTSNGFTFRFRKYGRIVNITLVSGTASKAISAGTTIATIPVAYRPDLQQQLINSAGAGGSRVNINTDGTVTYDAALSSGGYLRFAATYISSS